MLHGNTLYDSSLFFDGAAVFVLLVAIVASKYCEEHRKEDESMPACNDGDEEQRLEENPEDVGLGSRHDDDGKKCADDGVQNTRADPPQSFDGALITGSLALLEHVRDVRA